MKKKKNDFMYSQTVIGINLELHS